MNNNYVPFGSFEEQLKEKGYSMEIINKIFNEIYSRSSYLTKNYYHKEYGIQYDAYYKGFCFK